MTLVLQLKGTDVEANDRATVLQKWVLALAVPAHTLSAASPVHSATPLGTAWLSHHR